MSDIDLDRSVATNWREYKQEFRQMKDMVVWVWTELVSREGKTFMTRMIGWMSASCLLTVVLPLMFGYITDLLDPQHTGTTFLALMLALYGLLMITRQAIRYHQGIMREYLLGANMRQLDVRTTEMFLDKSLGMHISENNHLNEANVKEGPLSAYSDWKGCFRFEGIEAILNIVLPFISLWIFTFSSGRWAVGAIIVLILASHLAWTLFLNQQVLRVCLPIDRMWRFLNRYRVERWQRVERVKTNAKEEIEKDGKSNVCSMRRSALDSAICSGS